MARDELAIVMDGGGARAAYQVGFLRAVARRYPDLRVDVLTGVSAGAINATYLAATRGTFGERVEGLARLWSGLRIEDVIDPRPARLSWRAVRWGLRLASGGRYHGRNPRSLVDTRPLREFLHRALASEDGTLPGIQANIDRGELRAFAVTATSYSTGQTITYVQGRDIRGWERPNRRSRHVDVRIEHVMASSALPFLFPAVRLEDGWYGDGGMRLTAPLAPAIHLGAERLLAVSTRYARSFEEADVPVIDAYPPPAQVAGVMLNAMFLDQLDGDALNLQRINRLLASAPPEERRGLRPVELQIWRPSRDLGRLANDFEARLPRGLRFLVRGTGTSETRSNDFLSMILFQEDYVARLLETGEHDAERQLPALEAFLCPTTPSCPG